MARTRVLIVEDDEFLRASLIQVLEFDEKITVSSAGSLDEVRRLGAQALECQVAILDINLGANRPSGLDVFAWLSENRFSGRVAFLTGHAKSHPLVAQAMRFQGASVYEKPIGVGQLMGLIFNKAEDGG